MKVIDLCLDMPMGPEDLTAGLASMFLDPNYRGYKYTFAPKIASLAGLTP